MPFGSVVSSSLHAFVVGNPDLTKEPFLVRSLTAVLSSFFSVDEIVHSLADLSTMVLISEALVMLSGKTNGKNYLSMLVGKV